MTNRPEIFDSPVMTASVTPSLKYSCAGSWLRLLNGRTATDGLSGSARPADSRGLSHRQPIQPPTPTTSARVARTRIAATRVGNRRAPALGVGDVAAGAPGSRRRRYTRIGLAMF